MLSSLDLMFDTHVISCMNIFLQRLGEINLPRSSSYGMDLFVLQEYVLMLMTNFFKFILKL